MKRRWIVVPLAVVAIAVALSIGVVRWRSYVIRAQDERNYETAKTRIEENRFDDALSIIQSSRTVARNSGIDSERWLKLEIETVRRLGQVARLARLFERFPDAVTANEQAALLVVRAKLAQGDSAASRRLQDAWREQTSQPAAWFAMEVDALLMDGETEKARKLLESRSFEGPADCGRLARLAILTAKSDPDRSWQLLDQAYKLDPRNEDIRSFRGQILENAASYPDARVEYVAAYVADPENPRLCNQLAEFYRRQGNYALALDTWATQLKPPSTDAIWLKFLFFSRVALAADVKLDPTDVPRGDTAPLVRYLLDLPPATFWDASRYAKVIGGSRFEFQRQETFWLRLLQSLSDGDQQHALRLLKTNRFYRQSWNRDLEDALAWILAYRQGAIPSWVAARMNRPGADYAAGHPLFAKIAEWAVQCREKGEQTEPPAELQPLLKNNEVFAAALLAGGWVEAALRLHRTEVLSEEMPDWLAYGLTQAMRLNRDNPAALDFAKRQVPQPALNLLIGEIFIATGQVLQGLEQLEALAVDDSDIGFRAAWLASLAHLETRDFDEAEKLIRANPKLVDSTTGKEMLARIALLEGKEDEANRQYRQLGGESTEAMAYLARKAFEQKDWTEARRITLALMDKYPDEMQLRANLEAIANAEKTP